VEIRTIKIDRAQYGKNVGKLEAAITMKGGSTYPADITMPIPDEMLQPIVDLMMGAVAETMRRSTQEFTASIAALSAPAATAVIEDANHAV
jgi:hypothetical protein